MMTDRQFMETLNELERAATNIRNEFKSYNFHDYIEKEYDSKALRAKAKVLYDMVGAMANNKIAMMALAHEAVNHRRQLIKQIGENPHVQENWEVIMMALMMTS